MPKIPVSLSVYGATLRNPNTPTGQPFLYAVALALPFTGDQPDRFRCWLQNGGESIQSLSLGDPGQMDTYWGQGQADAWLARQTPVVPTDPPSPDNDPPAPLAFNGRDRQPAMMAEPPFDGSHMPEVPQAARMPVFHAAPAPTETVTPASIEIPAEIDPGGLSLPAVQSGSTDSRVLGS